MNADVWYQQSCLFSPLLSVTLRLELKESLLRMGSGPLFITVHGKTIMFLFSQTVASTSVSVCRLFSVLTVRLPFVAECDIKLVMTI